MQRPASNHYATLGLDRGCTPAQIRAAYRLLAKHHHPDRNPHSPDALRHTQALNAAHEVLSNPDRRAAHDRELAAPGKSQAKPRAKKNQRPLSRDVPLRLEDFLHGTTREVRVNDPANPNGAETYTLVVPPGTAPGTRFCLPRTGLFAGSVIRLRMKAQPHFQFKARGSDVRCDLKIKAERAAQGGAEWVRGITGTTLRVPIPRGIGRNEIIRVAGAGLPKPRGGCGDLLVRVIYRPEIRAVRPAGR